MKTHILKVRTEFFVELENGNKTCEIRHNDRDFQKGDVVVLCEHNGVLFNGKELRFEVTHVLSGWGLQENYVALSLRPIASQEADV